MATEQLQIKEIAGLNIYFVVLRPSDDKVLDFSDGTFKVLGSAVTPYVVATSSTIAAGYGNAFYRASVDLEDVSDRLQPTDIVVSAFLRAGGAPNLSTDYSLVDQTLEQIRASLKKPVVTAEICATIDRQLVPELLFLSVTLSVDGQALDLTTLSNVPTCSILVRQSNPPANAFPALTATIDADGRFVASQSDPFADDLAEQEFHAIVTITDGTETLRLDLPFEVTG